MQMNILEAQDKKNNKKEKKFFIKNNVFYAALENCKIVTLNTGL